MILLFLLAEKSAKVAITLSILIPGGGQIYTKNYIKAGIFGTSQSFLIYKTYATIQSVKEAEAQYNNTPTDSNKAILTDRILSRDAVLWWDAVVWFLASADAYVDAKMYNFNSNTVLIISPNPHKSLVMIRLKF